MIDDVVLLSVQKYRRQMKHTHTKASADMTQHNLYDVIKTIDIVDSGKFITSMTISTYRSKYENMNISR